MKQKTQKNSAMRKLIPATSMLLVSTVMLASSTYAWFTMSREVEVTGINLTASVPESLEISLGSGTKTGIQAATTVKLAQTNTGENLDKTKVTDITQPDVTANTTDWANTVSFSDHYIAGRLIPASSTDGNYLFKTNDATGVGKTVSDAAKFYNVTATDEAGLHVITNYTNASDTTDYKDLAQGYYLDFPVWLRTSAKDVGTTGDTGGATGLITGDTGSKVLNLGVKATITQRDATETDQNLYHAVRVAILDAANNTTGDVSNGTSDGLILDSVADYYDRYTTTNSNLTAAIVDQAVFSQGTLGYNPNSGVTSVSAVYGKTDRVAQATTADTNGLFTDGEAIVTVPLATTEKYGTATKYVVRVWLEGEDINCWNETAGQNFNISLRFVHLDATTANHGVTTASPTASVSNGTAPSPGYSDITVKCGTDTQTYTYDTTNHTYAYTPVDGTTYKIKALLNSTDPINGRKNYKTGDNKTVFANEEDLITYLNNYGNVYDFTNGLTITEVT